MGGKMKEYIRHPRLAQVLLIFFISTFFTSAIAGEATVNRVIARDAHGFEYIKGEYVVRFTNAMPALEAAKVFAARDEKGVAVKRVLERFNTLHIRIEEDSARALGVSDILKDMKASPDVALVEPNYIYKKISVNDPRYAEMWHLPKINVTDTWRYQSESPDIVVAVIDTGVFVGHEDLGENIWQNKEEIIGNGKDDDANGYIDDYIGWDFYNDDNSPDSDLVPTLMFGLFEDPTKREYEEHGTHVAGIIGAVGNNAQGIIGVTPRVKIMPLKFLGGTRGSGSLADAIAAIDYAMTKGVHIINASWGGGAPSENLKTAISDASKAGIIFIAAAGNKNNNNDVNPHYPSSYEMENLIAVAATDQHDDKASFSNYGLNSVDLAAPGVKILSTIPLGDESSNKPNGGYDTLSGTSMATPIVSGCMALARAHAPEIPSSRLVKILFDAGVTPVKALDGVVATGGRLNCALFLKKIRSELAIDESSSGTDVEVIGTEEFEWLITVRPGTSSNDKKRLLKELNEPKKVSPKREIYQFKATEPMIRELQIREGVQTIEKNTKFYIDR